MQESFYNKYHEQIFIRMKTEIILTVFFLLLPTHILFEHTAEYYKAFFYSYGKLTSCNTFKLYHRFFFVHHCLSIFFWSLSCLSFFEFSFWFDFGIFRHFLNEILTSCNKFKIITRFSFNSRYCHRFVYFYQHLTFFNQLRINSIGFLLLPNGEPFELVEIHIRVCT